MVSLPYWFFFEFLGPLVEFLGYIVFVVFLLLGIINWPFFLILFALVISLGFLYSIYGILVDLVSYKVYTKRKDFLRLIGTAFSEPFYFHPIVVKAGVNGFIDYFKKSHGWGEMKRQGFNQTIENLPLKTRISAILQNGLRKWGLLSSVFLGLFLIGVAAEWLWYRYSFPGLDSGRILGELFFGNILFAFRLIFGTGIIYLAINGIKESWARFLALIALGLVVISQYILFLYFSETHNLLGADILYYTRDEIKETLKASGMLSVENLALLGILAGVTLIPLWMAGRSAFKSVYTGITFLCIGLLACFIPDGILSGTSDHTTLFTQAAAKSKWTYFFKSNEDNFLNNHPEITDVFEETERFTSNAETLNKDFPFWRKENTPDFLGAYLNPSGETPNLVFIVLEGFGHAYTSPKGYIGNFTPFLDSLSQKSLYWENGLSSAGRTFGALPSLTGSLPFGRNGFLEIEKTPEHFNLFNILKNNGFETGFYYGGDVSFDRYREFLEYSRVDHLVDQASFGKAYQKLPSHNGSSWGYEDQAVFSKMLEVNKSVRKPYFDMILTLSTHNPFLINNTAYYENLYNKRMQSDILTADQKKMAATFKNQLISVINADDALRQFFEKYRARPDFANTIFMITGDHSMPEITLESHIDRFHVPLLIYSPLLKAPGHFRKTASHFDVAPSFLAYYRNNYQIKTPSTVTWVGRGFSPDPEADKADVPIMQSKDMMIDFVSGKHYIHDTELLIINERGSDPYQNENTLKDVSRRFNRFKNINEHFYASKKLMPDSVIVNFFKDKK